MGLYKNNNGVLIPIAGRGKAEYGASTTRRNTWTNSEAINPDSSIAFSVSFDVPMPDDNYEVDWTCSASALHPVIEEKTASGFTGHAYRLISPAVEIGNGVINFTAFRLYTDLEYNELLDDTSGLMKYTSETGAVNLFETTLKSQRYNKVIYTVNSDGTIGIEILERPTGSTGNILGWIDVKAGETYKLTGGISETERIELRNADYSAWTNNTVGKTVSSPVVGTNVDTFMPNNDATVMVYCRIDENGNTGNVGTLEPMIKFASFLDNTFLPYAKTNRLLTIETDELLDNASMLKGITAITAQTDLDDVTTLGNYYKSSTTIYVTNAPTGIDSETSAVFRLTVENGSDSEDTFIQTIVTDDGTTYKRGYDGTEWGDWTEFASSATVSSINTRLTAAETDIDNLESSRLKTYTSDATAWDTAPTSASTKPVTSGGIKTSLDNKLATYAGDATAWDTTPTANSTNPVTSGGVKTQIDTINGNKANQTVIATRQANLVASRRYEIGEQFIYNNTLYKATQVIEANTNINTATGGNATTADNITSQISNIRLKLLWSNSNPSSSFASQNIALSSSDYDLLLIKFATGVNFSTVGKKSVICAKGDNAYLDFVIANSSNNVSVSDRLLTYSSDTSYTANDCYAQTNGSSRSVTNTNCVPIAIYGFKI